MTGRKPKKDASITMHVPADHKEQLSSLAEMQRAGQGASEYVYENLVKPHLQKLKAETKIKQKIFGLTENYKNCEHRSDLSDQNEIEGNKKA
ncbi:hypothetical protein [Acinetobacter beijerinckii]|uniref:Uncharacterized protein n=1 Tax=Acinetobacter beijerinckii ANC 3835 TaxID=1217649 RepID=N9E6D2_9GAMM|nr:hypothetical protein [Acinetobacter beijerinckii]ENW05717.1 hypothetical protein F934_01074 [Acinetobacter beijerinckii ANC 3835]